jgi:hypothetical protein
MKTAKRKFISKDQFNSLKPFNKKSKVASEIFGLSDAEYWFQVCIEVTVDCDRHAFAVLEAYKR